MVLSLPLAHTSWDVLRVAVPQGTKPQPCPTGPAGLWALVLAIPASSMAAASQRQQEGAWPPSSSAQEQQLLAP